MYSYGNDLLTQTTDTQSLFYLADALGSVKALANESENLTDQYTYSPYGTLLEHSGTSDNAYMFTGEQFDSEIESYYLRARYYSPNFGRFLTRDTYDGRSFEPATLNHYGYVHGNPVNYTDPSGHMTMMGAVGVIGLSGVLAGGITSIGILNNNRGGYGGGIWATIINYEFRLLNIELYIASVLMAGILPEDRTEEEQKDSDYDYGDYKNYCKNNPKRREYPDDCSFWVASIVHTRKCIEKMESFDEKWTDNRHGKTSLADEKRRLGNLQENVNNICKRKK